MKVCFGSFLPPNHKALPFIKVLLIFSFYYCSVTQLCSTLVHAGPMNCSMTGLPVLHYLPEFTQIHVHRAGDAIQPSHSLSSPFPLPSILPSIRVFTNESALHIRWPNYWSFTFSIDPSNEYSGLISF